MSFGAQGDEWHGFTLQNYANLADSYFLKALWLTLRLAFQSMVCAVLLAIPVALAMARTESRLARRLLLAGVLLPLLVILLLQGYGWLVILGPAPSTLSVSEQGCIEGSVIVPNIVLNGIVKGDIEAGDRSPEIGRQHGGVDACGAVTAIDGGMDPGESAWANLAITSVW